MNPLEAPITQILRIIVAAKPQLIDAIGVEAIKFIDDNFDKSGFQGATFQPWAKRKMKDKGKSRKLLVETGTLRRSMKQTNHSDHTTISTDVPYAKAHNEGETISRPARSVILSYRGTKNGRLRLAKTQTESQQRKIKELRRGTIAAGSFDMPKRQFIGDSPVLRKACEKAVLKILIAKLPN